jgi:hypothetical protein
MDGMRAEAKLLDTLTADDRALFRQIVGAPVEGLVREIRSLPSKRYWRFFSGEKFLNWPELNRRGLHVFRTLLGTRLVEESIRRHGLWDTPESREFRKNGLLVRTDFLREEDLERLRSKRRMPPSVRAKLAWLVDCCIGSDTFRGKVWMEEFEYVPNDIQLDLHLDTFHPTVKIWYYPSDVSADLGPLHIVAGSHALTPAKLQWAYECSLIAADPGHPEYASRVAGSFRVNAGSNARSELERLGLEPEQPMIGRANTLFLVDTSALHRRGLIREGLVRKCARGDHRVSPFEGLRHPVRRRLTQTRERASAVLRKQLSGRQPASPGATPA